jgi:hypothetical protein
MLYTVYGKARGSTRSGLSLRNQLERAANEQINDMGSTQASVYTDDNIEFPPREATFLGR